MVDQVHATLAIVVHSVGSIDIACREATIQGVELVLPEVIELIEQIRDFRLVCIVICAGLASMLSLELGHEPMNTTSLWFLLIMSPSVGH